MGVNESPRSVAFLLPSIVKSYAVDGFGELLQFQVAGRMQRRAESAEVIAAVERAKLRKESTHQPFWDALYDELPSLADRDVHEVFHLAQFHQPMSEVATRWPFRFSSGDIAQALKERGQDSRSKEIVALSSRVRCTDGRDLHIPMLDFRVPVAPHFQSVIEHQLGTMRVNGWLFSSGRSYHFIGATLLEGFGGLTQFLGRALLFAPIVDGRWIAHQLIEGACALRVSAGNEGQISPALVCSIGTPSEPKVQPHSDGL